MGAKKELRAKVGRLEAEVIDLRDQLVSWQRKAIHAYNMNSDFARTTTVFLKGVKVGSLIELHKLVQKHDESTIT